MILKAFFAVAVRQGVHAASLRAVAAQAGISLRLVQYYFKTRGGLVRAGICHLEEESNRRWSRRIAGLAQPLNARAALQALFAEALPTDKQSREFHQLWMSYAVLAMTDPDLSGHTFVEGPNRLQGRIASILQEGKACGEFPGDLNSETEAAILLALINGMGTAVLVGQRTAEAAMTQLSLHVERLATGDTASEG